MTTVYLPFPDHDDQLLAELGARVSAEALGDGVLSSQAAPAPCAWAADIWSGCEQLRIDSIGQAARSLRERGAWWQHFPLRAVRRGELIAKKLPRIKDRPWVLPWQRRPRPCRGYTLLDTNTLLLSGQRWRPTLGKPRLLEPDQTPPSRAYGKLWEALCLLGAHPGPGDRVFDLGSCPGSWTWALANCGCEVTAVDKAPLDPAIAAMPNVTELTGSAFAVDPRHHQADWIFSDVICYPRRMHTFISRWLELGGCERFVITIKLQGEAGLEAIASFQDLGGQVAHLWHNKHEVTFIKHPKLAAPRVVTWPWLER